MITTTGASPVFTVCHKVISLVYSLLQYIIGDGILLSWTGPCGLNMTLLYPNLCYNKMCCKETALYCKKIGSLQVATWFNYFYQRFSYLSEVGARSLLNLGKNILTIKIGKTLCSLKELDPQF